MQPMPGRSGLVRSQNLMCKFPALASLGPRQVGKTTLARAMTAGLNGVYFDLERPSDRLS